MPKRILIADDLEHIRNLVRPSFEKAQKLKPDLIILDVSMPAHAAGLKLHED